MNKLYEIEVGDHRYTVNHNDFEQEYQGYLEYMNSDEAKKERIQVLCVMFWGFCVTMGLYIRHPELALLIANIAIGFCMGILGWIMYRESRITMIEVAE